MKRKELFWMIMPCLLLAGAGAYFSRRGTNGEFRVFVDEAKLIPITPRDVARGFDTRIRIKSHLEGTPNFPTSSPNGPQFGHGSERFHNIIAPKTGKVWKWSGDKKRLAISDQGIGDKWHSEIGIIRLNTKSIDAKEGDLQFHFNRIAEMWSSPQAGTGVSSQVYDRPYKISKVPLKFNIRPKNPSLTPPLSKFRPFRLVGFRTYWEVVAGGQIPHVIVIAKTNELSKANEGIDFMNLDNIRIISESGESDGLCYTYSAANGATNGLAEFVPEFRGVYVNADQNIILKADLSINECWPLPISVVLRKHGKNITRIKPAL